MTERKREKLRRQMVHWQSTSKHKSQESRLQPVCSLYTEQVNR